MERIYKVPFAYTGNAAPANLDLVELNAAAGMPLVLLGFTIFQTSDVGDAQEEIMELVFQTGLSGSGSVGGTAPTPIPNQGAPAASFTAEIANTTIATGTPVERGRWGWNVRMEKEKILAQFERILIPASGRGVFKFGAAPGDSITIRGELIVWEQG